MDWRIWVIIGIDRGTEDLGKRYVSYFFLLPWSLISGIDFHMQRADVRGSCSVLESATEGELKPFGEFCVPNRHY